MFMQKKEISAGAIIYQIKNNQILFLVAHMSLGHFTFAKGHLENDETLEEGALREIKEETSLDVILDTNFKYMIQYAPDKNNLNNIKDVYYFVAKVKNNKQVAKDDHDDEVCEILFLNLQNALKILTYQNDKDALVSANQYILKKENLYDLVK